MVTCVANRTPNKKSPDFRFADVIYYYMHCVDISDMQCVDISDKLKVFIGILSVTVELLFKEASIKGQVA